MLPLRMLAVLFLMFSSYDAENTCPTDFDFLELDPAEVVEEYGTSLLVNCSSTYEEHEGMRWRVGHEDFDLEDFYFVFHNLTLTDWNMTAQCKIRINDTIECSKDLNITVYKNPEVVSSVKRLTAGEETQYDLQCDITNVAPIQNLIVRWYYNDEVNVTVLFSNRTAPDDLTPKNETVDFSVKVRKGENAVQVRCEAQLDFGPRAVQPPVVSQTRNLSALYAPQFEGHHDIFSVSEGDNVTLRCDAEGNPPPVFDWTCAEVNLSEKTNNLNLFSINVSRFCICTAGNYVGNTTKIFWIYAKRANPTPRLTMEAPKKIGCPLTVTPPEIVVHFGDPVRANCSTTAADAVGMGWESTVGGIGSKPVRFLSWSVESLRAWDIQTSCYMNLNDGQQCMVTLPITLYKGPDTMDLFGLDTPMVEFNKYRLMCHMTKVAPARMLKVSWYRDDTRVDIQSINSTSVRPINVLSTLNITAHRDYSGSHFKCEVSLNNGSDEMNSIFLGSVSVVAVVHYAPRIKSCPANFTVVEHTLSMDKVPCEIDGNPPPTVQWYRNDEPINSTQPLRRNESGRYTVEFENPFGKTTFSLDITVESGPVFTCKENYEVEVNMDIQNLCKPDGLPAPTVTWFKDGKEMTHWTKHDSGEYVLKASNKHGRAEHTVKLNILYAPEFKQADQRVEVVQGENVTLVCRAEGNPPPKISWFFGSPVSPQETTEWRQTHIYVTRATSTDAGVYNCSATNRVGKATGTVTLVIKDKARGFPRAAIWWIIIIVAVLAILLIVVILCKRQKKHGQYSFIPPKGMNIPLTPTAGHA